MHQILHRPPADGPGGGGGGSGDGGGGGGGGRRVFSWCIWEVMGPCAPARDCGRCPLAADCAGRVKHADGWMPLADVRAMHARISRPVWESEMLCRRPYAADAVFAAFRCRRHVRPWPGGDPAPGEPVSLGDHPATVEALVAGVDFGWRTFVCLWIAMLRDPRGRRCLWVLDELVRDESTLAASIDAMKCRTPPAAGPADRRPWTPAVVYCDVAGRQKNAHTGQSSEQILRRAGFRVVSSAMNIADGIDALLELIDPALPSVPAETRFLVTPHCVHTIAALEGYRRQPDGTPRKDGRHDHLIDALRYALVNHDRRPAATTARLY